jgi:hypothetical protein
MRAGTPETTAPAGTTPPTALEAPTVAPSPMRVPGRMVTRGPMCTLRPISTGRGSGTASRLPTTWKSLSESTRKGPARVPSPMRTLFWHAMAAPNPIATPSPISSSPSLPHTRCEITGVDASRKRAPIRILPELAMCGRPRSSAPGPTLVHPRSHAAMRRSSKKPMA